MLAFIIQRLFQSVLVMLTVALIAFALFNYVGDPINNMVGQDTTQADRERLRQDLGLNALRRPIRPVCWPRCAGEFWPVLPAGAAGRSDHPRKDARDARIELHGGLSRAASRRSDGDLYWAASQLVGIAGAAGNLAGRRLAADLPDRHPAHSDLRRPARLAAVVRPRRGRPYRLVDDWLSDRRRLAGDHPAGDHPRPLPDDPDHAAG